MALTYKSAGVDIAAADAFVSHVFDVAKSTLTDGVVAHRLGYSGLFRPKWGGMRDPLLAATCDGVGTKLKVAIEVGRYQGLGQDLVAMNVNDLLPLGARPLLFLDYIAVGAIARPVMDAIIAGVAAACRETGCALLGGETAEMPGVYHHGDFDLAGFAVGLVDGARLPQPEQIAPGDVVLALASTGIHSNGLSLARQALFEKGGLRVADRPAELTEPLGVALLTPTALYVKAVLALFERYQVKGAAHVTGGGLLGRVEKLSRPGARLLLHPEAYSRPPIFAVIQRAGGISDAEMARTFNLGLGFVVVVDASTADLVERDSGLGFIRVGEVVAGDRGVELGYARSE
jgi:phosphoribosylformylglycinamidine cyclo-ligase